MKKYKIAFTIICLSSTSYLGCVEDVAGSFVDRSLRCEGNILQQFVDGEWKTKEECPDFCGSLAIGSYGCIQNNDNIPEYDCSLNYEVNKQRCTANRDGYEICMENGTLMHHSCKETEHCDITTAQCIEDSDLLDDIKDEECVAGTNQCHNNTLIQCGTDNRWTLAGAQFCADDEECIAGEFINGCFCTLDAFRCADNTPHTCVDFAWQPAEYSCGTKFTCSVPDKGCVKNKECSGNAAKCESDGSTLYYACTADGYWSDTPTQCPTDTICSNGACRSKDNPDIGDHNECSDENATLCRSENTYSTCVLADGKRVWSSPVACDANKICRDNTCIEPEIVVETPECEGSGAVCEGNSVRTCKDGKLSDPIPCNDQTCVDGKCTTVQTDETGTACEGEITKCNQDNTGIITCINGKWSDINVCGTGMICQNAACVTDTSTAECTTGAKRCDTTATFAKYQVCSNGVWGASKSCNSINSVCHQGECMTCIPGTTTCGNSIFNSDYVLTCNDSGSQYTTASSICNLGCNNGKCNVCSTGDVQCSDTAFQVCQDGAWSDLAVCDDAAVCSNNGCTCTKGATRCDDKGNVLECQEATVPGTRNKKYTAWVIKSSCGDAALCKDTDGAAACVCSDDSTRCAADGLSVEICHNGTWMTDTNCATDNRICQQDDEIAKCACNVGDYYCPTLISGIASSVRYYCGDNAEWNTTDYGCESGLCNSELGSVCVNTQCSNLNVEKISSATLAFLRINADDIGSKCEGSNLMTCSDGLYAVKSHCQSGCTSYTSGGIEFAYCRNLTTGCAITNVNDVRCGANNASVEKCKMQNIFSYVWSTEKTCSSSEICMAQGSSYACVTKECEPNALSCDGSKVQQCINNKHVDITDCADSNMACDAGKCIAK